MNVTLFEDDVFEDDKTRRPNTVLILTLTGKKEKIGSAAEVEEVQGLCLRQ